MNEETQNALDQAKEDFKDQVMVALLGGKGSGKTVHCALIKDAAAKHLKAHTNGKYQGIATQGSDRMNLLTEKLYSGKFPAPTYLEEATPMTIEIFSKSTGMDFKIILRDMSGETKEDLLEKEMPVDDRIEKIIKLPPIEEGKPYGLMTHLIFAKIYIIVIDCDEYDKWPSKQAYVKDTIRHLFEIKECIGDIANNRIHAPIAIVFTKYDTLSKTKQKPVKELMVELEEINGALEKYHKGPISYFTSSVVSIEIPKKELDALVKKKIEDDNEDKNKAENTLADKEAKKRDAKNTLVQAKEKVNEAQQKLDQVTPSNDQNQIKPAKKELDEAKKELEEADQEYSETTSEHDDARKRLNDIKEKLAKETHSPEEVGVSKYKPNRPLSYSRDDYLDLIMWLVKMNKQIRGF